jgi:hypothetical protein
MEPALFDPSVGLTEPAATWTPSPDEDRTMGKYERRIFLDRLVELRQGYQRTRHAATSMTAQGAINYAIALLDEDPSRLEAILAEDSADTTSTSDSPA